MISDKSGVADQVILNAKFCFGFDTTTVHSADYGKS